MKLFPFMSLMAGLLWMWWSEQHRFIPSNTPNRFIVLPLPLSSTNPAFSLSLPLLFLSPCGVISTQHQQLSPSPFPLLPSSFPPLLRRVAFLGVYYRVPHRKRREDVSSKKIPSVLSFSKNIPQKSAVPQAPCVKVAGKRSLSFPLSRSQIPNAILLSAAGLIAAVINGLLCLMRERERRGEGGERVPTTVCGDGESREEKGMKQPMGRLERGGTLQKGKCDFFVKMGFVFF